MLPRTSNITSASNTSKSKPLQPISLLSFGIRMNPKQQLPSKTSHRDITNSCKIVQNSALNHQKKYSNMQQMQICKGTRNFIDEQGREMHFQNQQCKGQNQKDMFLLGQNISKRKIFSDQITQKPHLLKLNNITNMYLDQKQSLKDLSFKNQISTLTASQLVEDNCFENDIESKTQKIYVDMKKKIKKISKSKRLFHKFQRIQPQNAEVLQNQVLKIRREMAQHHKNLMNLAYLDSEIIVDSSIFCNKVISHRIDNDVDTDDEQIASGINKLKKSLEEALQYNKKETFENIKLMEEIQNYQDHSMQEQICEQNQAYFH